MSEDGRLSEQDLDELLGGDQVSTELPADRPGPGHGSDVLLADEPGWTERGLALARRHRLLAGAIAALAVAAVAGGWSYQANRPPPEVPISATVAFDQAGSLPGMELQVDTLVRAQLQLRDDDPANPVRAVALLGPGLEQPQVSQRGAKVVTSNVLNCNDILDLNSPGPYALRVARTDAWDRTVTADLPLRLLTDEAGQIGSACVGRLADSLALRATKYVASGATSLRLTLLNPTARDLYVGGAFVAARGHDEAYFGTGTPPVALTAGMESRVDLYPPTRDCLRRTVVKTSGTFRPDGRRGGNFGLYLTAAADGSPQTANGTRFLLAPRQARVVQRALDRPCAGAPTLRYDLTDVAADRGPDPALELTLRVDGGSGIVSLLPNAVFLAVGDDSSTAVFDSSWQGVGQVTKVAGATNDSSGWARLRWHVQDCPAALQLPPPTYRVVVRSGQRNYQYLVPIRGRAVLHALVVACDGGTPIDARRNGWYG